jgi:MFS transporter, FHS family, glucose/mannose:H+ symporter
MMHYNPKVVFWAACFGMLLFGIGLITLGSVAIPLAEKFQLTQVDAGTLFFIMPFGILFGSLVFGPLCDRYGYKPVLIISCLFMFAGFQGIAWSGSLLVLNFSVFLFGVSGGAINGATNAVVSDITSGNKGANLSLLGVFFAIGSISVPFLLGMLQDRFRFDAILSAIGGLTILAAALYVFTRFPQPKQKNGVAMSKVVALLKDKYLLAIAFFLFLVSSLEGVVNNWTTTYFERHLSIPQENALFALSSYVVGMAAMRILLGSIFRNVRSHLVVFSSLFILLAGALLLAFCTSYAMAVTALVMMGIGLAMGFPVMLGLTGARYAEISGTAFSFVLVIALIGNMLINFLVGVISEHFGIQHMTTVAVGNILLMFLLAINIFKTHKSISILQT